MLITALIEGLKAIKEPCKLEVYTQSPLGFKNKKSPNKDLLENIRNICLEKRIEINEIVSDKNQYILKKILKESHS